VVTIINKSSDKFKDFLSKSKKMFHPPKELPPINPTPIITTSTPSPQPSTHDSAQLTIKTETPTFEIKKTLPRVEIPRSQEITIAPVQRSIPIVTMPKKEEERTFDDAIRSIHMDVMRNHQPESAKRHEPESKDDYYAPKDLSEGYFSEIKHYINNKNFKEISEDILNKDFLTGMKDYHEQKSQGKPYYLHNQDLHEKLELRMRDLMEKEQLWHELKRTVDDAERKKKALEKDIDADAQELKEMFKLIKVNSVLEKPVENGQQFVLKSGPKLGSLNDLRKTLNYISDEEFNHHVNEEHNDFAAWTEVAIGLPLVANKMRELKKKRDLMDYLNSPL
jgi:hypothetical protein